MRENRNVNLMMRINAREQKAIKAAADKSDKNLSEFVRECVHLNKLVQLYFKKDASK